MSQRGAVCAPGKSAAAVWSPCTNQLVAREPGCPVGGDGGPGRRIETATSLPAVTGNSTGSDHTSAPAGITVAACPPKRTVTAGPSIRAVWLSAERAIVTAPIASEAL